jgi:class 3 adenylate cyclase/TolB-like protein/rhodanese-related sulfurtransferase
MSESQPEGEVEERRLAAVLAADIAGYGRLMGADEVATLQALKAHRRDAIDPIVARYRGRIVRTTGDGMLVEFVSAADAVQCAVDIQRCMAERNADVAADRRIEFRIGINVSDIIGDAGDIYGDGVNVAARLESLAEPGGILVSRAVRDPVRDKLALGFEDLGEIQVKNITRPIHAFRVRTEPEPAVIEPPPAPKRWTRERNIAAAGLLLVLCVAIGAWYSLLRAPPAEQPPAAATTNAALRPEKPPIGVPPAPSLVVLPFENAGNDSGDLWLVDGVSDDLARELGDVPGLFVISRASAYTYRTKAMFVKRIGTELGVRYAVEGSVRRNGPALRINAMLISTESGAQLWSGEFDESIRDLPQGPQQIAARIREALGIASPEAGPARQVRTSPEAYELILRARVAQRLRPAPEALADALRLYEMALQQEPDSVLALAGAAATLVEGNQPPARERLERAAQYLARAQALAPDEATVLSARVLLARPQEQWREWTAAATRLVSLHPNVQLGNEQLSASRMLDGKLDDAVALIKAAMRLNPRDPVIQLRYGRIAYLMALAARGMEALDWAHWSLTGSARELNPEFRAEMHLIEASGYARTGDIEAAQRAGAEAHRLWPLDTVRSHGPYGRASPEHQTQIRAWQDALRLAGYRDHADPEADFGVPADDRLHANIVGQTPKTAPGATTISTADLASLLASEKPLVIDAMSPNFWYRSIPGAAGLPWSGFGDETKGPVQDRLGRKLKELTGGNAAMPIVAVGWNSERFDGRNLALRLVSLGYTNVYWYRGGLEAWEVAGQPEAELVPQDW